MAITHETESLSALPSGADTACYAAKEGGGNRVCVYQEDDAELTQRRGQMGWVSRIQSALSENRLLLFYQDITSVKNQQPRGRHYEILIRMNDEQGRLISPGHFLPAAERYSLMNQLDRWVIHSCFAWLSHATQRMNELELCAINLSGSSVCDDEFLEFIVQELQSTGIAPEKICFEITETAAVANLSKASIFIHELKQHGCRFALDDFGTGMSCFSYLKNLPVDFLKIDGSFVRNLAEDEIDLAMVRSINEIGHVMGKQTVAEFVENEAILTKLRDIGVDYAQGYGITRPMRLSG